MKGTSINRLIGAMLLTLSWSSVGFTAEIKTTEWQQGTTGLNDRSTADASSATSRFQQATLMAQADAMKPQQVASKRPIRGMPPLFESPPDPDSPGRFVSFTATGCRVSFAIPGVRGLGWSGGCAEGRAQGSGTLMIYDYESQPIGIFEGVIERGRRVNGVFHGFERRDGKLAGMRSAMVNGVPQGDVPVAFLDLPRSYLLALDDWNRQTSGENLLVSMGVSWAPAIQSASAAVPSSTARQDGRNPATRHGDSAACQCLTLAVTETREVLRNSCREVYFYFCVEGYDCGGGSVSSAALTQEVGRNEKGINNAVKGIRQKWGYGAAFVPEVAARKRFNSSWSEVKANGWVCSENRTPVRFASDSNPGAK